MEELSLAPHMATQSEFTPARRSSTQIRLFDCFGRSAFNALVRAFARCDRNTSHNISPIIRFIRPSLIRHLEQHGTNKRTRARISLHREMKPIHAISEELFSALGKLDAVPSWGDSAVREARKSLAGAVEGEAARLEAWIIVVWFSRNGNGKAPTTPQPAFTQMPQAPSVPQAPFMPQAPTQMPLAPGMSQAPTMPQAHVQQNEKAAWEQELQDRDQRRHQQPPAQPQYQHPPQTNEHPSLPELFDLCSCFNKLSADFDVPEILEYTLQPARSMSNGLDLIARLETSFLSYRPFSPSSQALPTKYSGPPLAFSASNKPVNAYSESLVQMLSALDAVESGGEVRVLDARKALAGDVEGEAGRIERWWKEAWVPRSGEAEVVKVRT